MNSRNFLGQGWGWRAAPRLGRGLSQRAGHFQGWGVCHGFAPREAEGRQEAAGERKGKGYGAGHADAWKSRVPAWSGLARLPCGRPGLMQWWWLLTPFILQVGSEPWSFREVVLPPGP